MSTGGSHNKNSKMKNTNNFVPWKHGPIVTTELSHAQLCPLQQLFMLVQDWVLHGRPCPPRVLFLFLSAPISLRGNRGIRWGYCHILIQIQYRSLNDWLLALKCTWTYIYCINGGGVWRDERRDAKGHKHSPIQRLEFSLEDQIYRILRKARYIYPLQQKLFSEREKKKQLLTLI